MHGERGAGRAALGGRHCDAADAPVRQSQGLARVIYSRFSAHTHVGTHARTHTHTYPRMHARARVRTHTCTHTYTHTHMPRLTHTNSHACKLAHTHARAPSRASGVLMTSYEENPKLKDFFKVLSLSLDRKGLPYISTMEARKVGEGLNPPNLKPLTPRARPWRPCPLKAAPADCPAAATPPGVGRARKSQGSRAAGCDRGGCAEAPVADRRALCVLPNPAAAHHLHPSHAPEPSRHLPARSTPSPRRSGTLRRTSMVSSRPQPGPLLCVWVCVCVCVFVCVCVRHMHHPSHAAPCRWADACCLLPAPRPHAQRPPLPPQTRRPHSQERPLVLSLSLSLVLASPSPCLCLPRLQSGRGRSASPTAQRRW
jgi:hypothetical protein